MDDMNKYSELVFENIKQFNEYGEECWFARDLQVVLEYSEWRNFKKVIDKAKAACKQIVNDVSDHFVEVNKTIKMPKGAQKTIKDMMLSRYAC